MPNLPVGTKVYMDWYKLEKGTKATDWTPAPEDTDAKITSVREYASEIEQKADSIKSSVTALEKDVTDQGVKISDNQSLLKQHATEIMSRVTKTTYETDMEDMTTRVSKAESSITQNAENITLKVSKNGVVSSINLSPEKIKIKAERLAIDGDLVVRNGKIYVKDGIITNDLIAENAKIDFAKIANVKITNAMIQSVNAAKINAGILDAEKVTVQVKNGTQAIQIDDKGFKSVDSGNKVRIFIGIRDLGGKGQSDPASILFYSQNGDKKASIGMNVNDHFIVGSQQQHVPLSLYAGDSIFHWGDTHTFAFNQGPSSNYFRFNDYEDGDGDWHPRLYANRSGCGYVGISSRRLWRVYTNHIHWVYKHESSTRKDKTNIQELDTRYLQSIFDKVTLKSFNRIIDTGEKRKVDTDILSFGQIAEESPDEITDPGKESINEGNYIAVIAGSLKYQTNRVDLHDNEIVSLKNKVASLENEVKALREEK